ncbi:MAG: RNase adapter RapZ [Alphaproteobacteria bacterium]|nr:RNase adapter RapZ [Alphaproteobacteria bacterium]MEC9264706.1 RNase adapter RapZ [Pseudomonadota bacterium]
MTGNRDTLDLVLVTGMSGAGRSTALAVLEDLGFEAVDNLPLTFLARLAQSIREDRHAAPIAIGVDIRSRDFGVGALQVEIDKLKNADGLRITTVFLDCDDDELLRRFTETRRRHPLAADRPVADGIRLERRAIAPLAERADMMVDTTGLTVWDFKQRMTSLFGGGAAVGAAITVMSFSYRRGIPREADMVLDVRFLKNPHYDPALRDLTGLDAAVGAAIAADPDCEGFLSDLQTLLSRVLPRQETEGKSYLTIAFGCTGGKHRSVYMAERLALWLTEQGRSAYRFHRDMPKPETEKPKRDGLEKDSA